jgi:predicted MFS family arabinose efflux permease
VFYVLRFVLGLAEAGFYPGIVLYLTYWYPTARFAKATAVFMAAIPLSGIIGNPLSGWIMDATHGTAGLHGWQWMFLLEAVPSVVMGIVVWFYLDDGIRGAHWLTESEKKVLARAIAHNDSTKQGPHSVATAFRDGRFWLLCLVYFGIVAGLYGLAFWLPTLVRATGIQGNLKIGLLSAIPYLVAVVAMILLGRSADARRERRWHVVVPALVGAGGLVGAALTAGNAVVAISFLSVAAAGILGSLGLFWSLPTAFLQNTGAAAGIGRSSCPEGRASGCASPTSGSAASLASWERRWTSAGTHW